MKSGPVPATCRIMTDFAPLLQPDLGQPAISIEIVAKADFDVWFKSLAARARTSVDAAQFVAKPGELVRLPGDAAEDWSLALGAADPSSVWDLAGAAGALPAGTYRLSDGEPGARALGWLLAQDRFDRYRPDAVPAIERVLLTANPGAIEEQLRLARATALVRALVNTPASDLGPAALQSEVERLASENGATCRTTKGHDLETGFPLIHAVGKAAERNHSPRLIELEWGNPAHPRVALIGKGITFDSGGLDIKSAAGMRIMKKDMGGAAHAIALAELVMQARLPVRLHLLVAAAENAISGNAMRPGDIVPSRAGITVEIDNTDAEGRLVLADAMTRAGENAPEMMIDFATLTGAARVALGPDLPALFANDHDLARQFSDGGLSCDDPVWRLPLWTGYGDMLKSDIADTANSGEGGMAGAITAALFLRKFVPDGCAWAHLDTFAWRNSARPGRPKGGEALGMRAAYAMLKARYVQSG